MKHPAPQRMRECLAYNAETGELTYLERGPGRRMAGKIVGGDNGHGYARVTIDGKRYLAHRVAFAMGSGRWPADEVDHINGNRRDNRFCNLREATSAEQKQNMVKRSTNKSGVTGVNWDAFHGRWLAQLTVGGKTVLSRTYATIEEAAAARESAKRQHHTFQPEERK